MAARSKLLRLCLLHLAAISYALQTAQLHTSLINQTVHRSQKCPVLICPAQLSIAEDYEDMIRVFNRRGHQAYGADLTRLGWILGLAPSLLTWEYVQGTLKPSKTLAFFYDAIDRGLDQLKAQHPGKPFHLVGHSIGGWVFRGWLSERASPEDQAQVLSLTTLGTPNRTPPPGSPFGVIDQTRGLLTFINDNFPAGTVPNVKYTSVIGLGVKAKFPSLNPDEILASVSYTPLGGDPDGLGDGIVPWRVGIMEGSDSILLPEAKHSGFLPTPSKAIQLKDYPWYGDSATLKEWAGVLDEAEALYFQTTTRAKQSQRR